MQKRIPIINLISSLLDKDIGIVTLRKHEFLKYLMKSSGKF